MPDFEKKNLRDKDNAAPRIKPPRNVRVAPRGFAPPGMVGIRPSPQLNNNRLKSGQAPKPPRPPKRFALGKSGDLKKEFKPLVAKSPIKDRGIDR
ncbi:MAG: hypothetical protein COA69_04130 [Robiginitomaculum sp.]|nr:MAG: hypothetical protein COA69_04130 [Robiginitomaculum sp.]